MIPEKDLLAAIRNMSQAGRGLGDIAEEAKPPSGHVLRVERARGPVRYANYRLPDGRQVQKKIGPAWTSRGRSPDGYLTKRGAKGRLREVLHEASRGTLIAQVRTGATFADAAAEWLRCIEVDRERKPSTVAGYRWIVNSSLLPAFGRLSLEAMTTADVERWLLVPATRPPAPVGRRWCSCTAP